MHLVKLLFTFLAFFSQYVLSQVHNSRFNTTVMSINKDAKTSLPTLSGYSHIDLDAPFGWQNCIINTKVGCQIEDGCRFPVRCDTTFCKEAHSYINPTCPSLNITNKYGCKICAVTPFNPISKSCKLSQLTTDLLLMEGTDGHNPSTDKSTYGIEFVVSCAPSSLLRSFSPYVGGVSAFSWSALAFPRQLHNHIDMADKFALCLPSSSKDSGVTFLGEGPFYFTSLPNVDLRSILSYTPMVRKDKKSEASSSESFEELGRQHLACKTSLPNVDLRSILSYTPMVRKDKKSLGYYIGINKISIKGISIPLPSLKSGSVKLSTVTLYTTLRSDIYEAFVSRFSMATKNIPRLKAVQPFSLCLKSSAVGSVNKGFRVPKIDLEMESGKNWTISGDNLMKRVGNGTACLAFIDGGLKMKEAIVIGTFQMENNFLFFDLANQKLGFSSSLLSRGTSCSSFNFTYVLEH